MSGLTRTLIFSFVLIPMISFSNEEKSEAPQKEEVQKTPDLLTLATTHFQPMAKSKTPLDQDKFDLGRKLYFDRLLSKSNRISCNVCHDLRKYGADSETVCHGHEKAPCKRNTPTIFNVAGKKEFGRSGQYETLSELIAKSMTHPLWMAMPSGEAVVKKLLKRSSMVDKFKQVFRKETKKEALPEVVTNIDQTTTVSQVTGTESVSVPAPTLNSASDATTTIGAVIREELEQDSTPQLTTSVTIKDLGKDLEEFDKPLNFDNLIAAIEYFVLQLNTPSRFDQFLSGNEKALSEKEKGGLKTFIEVGCINCHSGTHLSSSKKYISIADKVKQKSEAGEAVLFLPAGLRNVSETGPYYYNGSEYDLANVVRLEAREHLGVNLLPEQTQSIVIFFKSLTGKLPQI